MMVAGMLILNENVLGQAVCEVCNSTCGSGATAQGDCSFAACDGSSTSSAAAGAAALAGGSATGVNAFAAGESAFAHNTDAIAIGRKVTSNATNSVTLGYRLTVGSTASNSILIGYGMPGTITNSISNSMMFGMNSDVSTMFIEDAGGTSGSYGNVGIGNITSPASLLHVRDEIRLGLASNDNGSIIFNNSTNANTVMFQSGVFTQSQTYTLPLVYGNSGDVLTYNTGGQLTWEEGGGSDDWALDGNGGTTAGTNFLGTTDAEDLVIKTNGTEKMRVLSGGNVGIGTTAPSATLHVRALAQSSTGENVARFAVSDASNNDRISVENLATTNAKFAGRINGFSEELDRPALSIRAYSWDDEGTAPVMELQARSVTTIATRPIFRLSGHNTAYMTLIPDPMNSLVAFLGIGTTTPKNRVDVEGGLAVGASYSGSSTAPTNGAIIQGNVGIGTTAPSGRLHVNGDLWVANLPGGNGGVDVGQDPGTNDQLIDLNGSKEAYKANVDNLSFDKEAFLGIQLRRYDWKPFYGGGNDVGMIAEEVEQQFPDLVYHGYARQYLPNGDVVRDSIGVPIQDSTQLEVRGVKYHKLSIYLMALVKEQEQRINQLEQFTSDLSTAISSCCDNLSEPSYRFGSEEDELNELIDEYVLLRNDPNPFSDYTDISYETTACLGCEIMIIDVNGRLVKRIKLNTSSGTIRLYSSEIGNGLFSYSLLQDGHVIKSQKMVSAKR